MSLFSRIPTTVPQSDDLPFLHLVDFKAYAEKLATLACQWQDTAADLTKTDSEAAKDCANGNGPLVRLVGFEDQLKELRMVLAAANTKNAWVSGPRGIGKTSLIEALMRLRAERRLSAQMMVKPVFLFDVSAFFKQPREVWAKRFDATMDAIVAQKGLVVIDHFDDFVRMGDGEAKRLVNTFVSALENHDETQAIIISDTEQHSAIHEASTGVERRFQVVDLNKEIDAATLKRVLMAHFWSFERLHKVDFTEEAADEIIHLLERYPGRAFVDVRPKNAVAFADRVGTYVQMIKYAEPEEIGQMREQVCTLRDKIAVLSPRDDAEQAQRAALRTELEALEASYQAAEAAWREPLAPLFKAQDTLRKLEEALRPLQNNPDRTPAQDKSYGELKAAYAKDKQTLATLEKTLAPERPRVTIEHVRSVFHMETGIPVATLSQDKLARLATLNTALDANVFLQSEAKIALAGAYSERELGVSNPARPAGVFILIGGTGVGKTELVRTLATFDAGEPTDPVTLRLSEFQGETAVKKLLGADPGFAGYDAGSPFLDPIEKNGRSILLFDEADKANPKIFGALLQVLEDGKLCNAKGKVIDFKDTIIVIALNGLSADDFSPDELHNQDLIRKKLLQVLSDDTHTPLFKPEFLGRITKAIVFENLGVPEAVKILGKELKTLNRDYGERGLSLSIDDATAQKLVDHYYIPSMGGRSLRAIAQEHIRPLIRDYLMDRLTSAPGLTLRETLQLQIDENAALTLIKPDGQVFVPKTPVRHDPAARDTALTSSL